MLKKRVEDHMRKLAISKEKREVEKQKEALKDRKVN